MAKYICDYCGKSYARSGHVSASAKHHFCGNPCKGKYMREHGIFNNNIKVDNPKNKIQCFFCKQTTMVHSFSGRYCSDCRSLGYDYRRRNRALATKNEPTLSVKTFLNLVITDNTIHKPRALYIQHLLNKNP